MGQAWITQAPQPLSVVRADLTLVWCNERAETMLSRSRTVFRRGELLACETAAETARLEVLVSAALKTGGGTELLGTVDSAEHVAVRATRLAIKDGPPLIGLAMNVVSARAVPALPDLHRVFGITPTEREVLDMLLRGFSSRETAERLNISLLTVRTHTKYAYSKLGVGSKEQLFARLFGYLALAL